MSLLLLAATILGGESSRGLSGERREMVFCAGGACPTPVGYGEMGMLCRATPFPESRCFQQQVHAAMGSCQSPQWGWWSAGCADQPPWCGYPVLSQPYSSHSSPFSGGRWVWSLIRSLLLGNHPQNHGNRAASLPHTKDGCCPGHMA